MPNTMTIAEAALATGLTTHTLRYYEQIGLIEIGLGGRVLDQHER